MTTTVVGWFFVFLFFILQERFIYFSRHVLSLRHMQRMRFWVVTHVYAISFTSFRSHLKPKLIDGDLGIGDAGWSEFPATVSACFLEFCLPSSLSV